MFQNVPAGNGSSSDYWSSSSSGVGFGSGGSPSSRTTAGSGGSSGFGSAAAAGTFGPATRSGGSDSASLLSNEDEASTRTFQRTTSAQVILEEANAILAESDKSLAVVPDQMETDQPPAAASAEDDQVPDVD